MGRMGGWVGGWVGEGCVEQQTSKRGRWPGRQLCVSLLCVSLSLCVHATPRHHPAHPPTPHTKPTPPAQQHTSTPSRHPHQPPPPHLAVLHGALQLAPPLALQVVEAQHLEGDHGDEQGGHPGDDALEDGLGVAGEDLFVGHVEEDDEDDADHYRDGHTRHRADPHCSPGGKMAGGMGFKWVTRAGGRGVWRRVPARLPHSR